MILVRKDLAVQEWQDDTWNNIETVACQVKFGEQKLFVGCIYRPSNSPIDYNEIVRQTIRKISNSYRGQVLICGDFNFREIDWGSNVVEGSAMS